MTKTELRELQNDLEQLKIEIKELNTTIDVKNKWMEEVDDVYETINVLLAQE